MRTVLLIGQDSEMRWKCVTSALFAMMFCASTVAHAGEGKWRNVEPSDDPRINGLLSSATWTKHQLKFAFPDKTFLTEPEGTKLRSLGGDQRAIIRQVFSEIGSFADIRFKEVDNADIADLTFARWNRPSVIGVVRGQWLDSEKKWIDIPGQTWISDVDADRSDAGNYTMHWWRHEIGHIVGLEHPHNNRYFPPLPAALDNISHTNMSYRLTGDDFLDLLYDKSIYPTSYMPLDILAMQYLWGVKWGTNISDTIYKFSPQTGDYWIDGERQRGNPAGMLFLTLWDGFGNDTLDFSGYDTDGTFDLRPGHFSTPSPDQLIHFTDSKSAEGSIAVPYLPRANPWA